MAKIAILGDIHVAARNSNKIVEKWQNRFYDDLFFPYLEEHGITTVIQMGDWFDSRKWINVQSVDNMIDHIIKPSDKLGVNWHVLIGNHDIPLKNSLKGHTPGILLKQYENFKIWDEVGTEDIDGTKFTFLPWICQANETQSFETINQGGDILLGHLEVNGFVMHPGAVSKGGISAESFKNWDKVWSGHYHTQSHVGNIHYLGTPFQMSWSDASTKHGFWVFDTTDRSMQFIENPFRYFHRLFWEDGCNYDITKINDGYVKINIQKKTDFESFEKFIDQVNFNTPAELKVIESYEEFNHENVQELINLSSTEDLIEEYIDDVATNSSKENIKNMMLEIYHEAMAIEE